MVPSSGKELNRKGIFNGNELWNETVSLHKPLGKLCQIEMKKDRQRMSTNEEIGINWIVESITTLATRIRNQLWIEKQFTKFIWNGRFKWGVQISRWWNPLATEEPLKSHIRKTAKIFCLATIPVSLKTAPEGNHLERFRETATIIKRKVIEALRKPKEVSARFTNQEDSLRTTTLECDIIVNGYTVPATIDSGAATSIIARNTMEQLGFDIEEATNCKIILANGEKTESLGKIKDFPVEINDRVIPINMEVMETGAYHILLGNDWMMKAGASYNWNKQELTLNWRNQVIKTTASCKQNNNSLESIEEEYESEDEEQIQVLFQENYIN
ncbi:hypothetical protein Glove_427g15 [Diversispora epigaea]|uniref:Peptidase A2 domain-containing protein n=1 Tax=Diversispora epigaea TaxID=1348612 RepID=A0A397GTU6_9GLOM|nr:hypothetical protein Glove_427g15 [Diversispora epigaea]